MAKGGDTKRFSARELRAMRARGEDRTDWARVDAKTEEELERDIASDPDWKDIQKDWYLNAVPVRPKKLLSLRIDSDLVDWFKSQGPGYQTHINAVLRAFVEQVKKRA